MKQLVLAVALLSTTLGISQTPIDYSADNSTPTETHNNYEDIGGNGYNFTIIDAGVNSKFSEFGSGFFRNKLIMVSSKKLGGFAKIDKNTNEAYKELYCLDVNSNGDLSSPFLFSRILNTADSEDQLAFGNNQNTVYYTRSSKSNSMEYKLYKADLEPNSNGNWINHEMLSLNQNGVSVEHPFVSPKGDKLYFSSNRDDSYGGFDIYEAPIKADGSIGTPKNLGPIVNTSANEKYPTTSKDGKYLYFSSNGHQSIGGYDVFASRILKTTYKTPRNMGNTINSKYNEVAYFLAAKNKGYVSSDKPNGKGGYDIYIATNDEVVQKIKGNVKDIDSKKDLPNATLTLFNEEGEQINTVVTDKNGTFELDVTPFEVYTISTAKEGFENNTLNFTATKGYNTTYTENFELKSTLAPIVLDIDNIYFDFDKWSIKETSYATLDKVADILKRNPEQSLVINAHTDNIGSNNYNLKLSSKRADATVAYLANKGIAKNRLQAKGFGETQPKVDCNKTCTEEQLEQNRRVEFNIIK